MNLGAFIWVCSHSAPTCLCQPFFVRSLARCRHMSCCFAHPLLVKQSLVKGYGFHPETSGCRRCLCQEKRYGKNTKTHIDAGKESPYIQRNAFISTHVTFHAGMKIHFNETLLEHVLKRGRRQTIVCCMSIYICSDTSPSDLAAAYCNTYELGNAL